MVKNPFSFNFDNSPEISELSEKGSSFPNFVEEIITSLSFRAFSLYLIDFVCSVKEDFFSSVFNSLAGFLKLLKSKLSFLLPPQPDTKNNSNIIKIDQFEETLSNIELVNNFNIFKFDNKKNIYKIIFNGTRDQFLDVMEDYDYFFEIKNKIWLLK